MLGCLFLATATAIIWMGVNAVTLSRTQVPMWLWVSIGVLGIGCAATIRGDKRSQRGRAAPTACPPVLPGPRQLLLLISGRPLTAGLIEVRQQQRQVREVGVAVAVHVPDATARAIKVTQQERQISQINIEVAVEVADTRRFG